MHIKYQKYYFTRTFAHNSFTYHLYSNFKPMHQCFTLKLMRTSFMILTLGNFPLSQLKPVTLILDEMILMSSTWAIGLLELVQTWRHSHLVQNEELKVTNTWWRKNILAAVDDINKVKKLRVHYSTTGYTRKSGIIILLTLYWKTPAV